jgi:hypothetical protein
MRRLVWLVPALFAVVFAFAGSALADTITDLSSWDGTSMEAPFGYGGTTEAYGQTILGNGENLSSFTFYLNVPTTVTFQAAVYTWTGTRAGTLLWQSADQSPPAGTGFRATTVTLPSGITLTSGQEYVLFFTTLYSTGSSSGSFGAVYTNPYPGGDLVYINTTQASNLTGASWVDLTASDFAFTANFTPYVAPVTTPPVTIPSRVLVCTTKPQPRGNDTTGTFFDITDAEWEAGLADPTSPLYGSVPAVYVQGFGATCLLTDIVTWGGNPSGYKDTGTKVDESGIPTPAGVSPNDWGAIYEYYASTG